MRLLWLTRLVPYRPFLGGDALYSAGLIESLATQGIQTTVVTRGHQGGDPPTLPGVNWVLTQPRERPRIRSLLGKMPSQVYRSSTPDIRRATAQLMAQRWDAIAIDSLAMADAIDWRRVDRSRTKVVYVAHNHETSIRKSLGRALPIISLPGVALRLDGAKVSRTERELVRRADLVTTTTEEDAHAFQKDVQTARVVVVSPGYSGPRRQHRVIDESTPRRVVLLGSYHWVAKQHNLMGFLAVAAEPLATARIGIDVVGSIPPSLAGRLRRLYPHVQIAGAVDDVSISLERARLGLVVERLGGGFKLKVLDYAFRRVPIAALAGSTAGTPLSATESSLIEYQSLDEMPGGIRSVIDDFGVLNALHEKAYAACTDKYEWADRGRLLAEVLNRDRPGS